MTAREAVARALCAAEGDDWEREGPSGLLEAYGPLADAALAAARPYIREEPWHVIADTPPPPACHILAARFDHDIGDWVLAFVASPPIYPFTHWRMPDTPLAPAIRSMTDD